MEQITIDRIKRTQLILLLAAFLLFLGGCGKEDADSVENFPDKAVPMSGGVDIEHFGSEEWTGGNVETDADRETDANRETDADRETDAEKEPDGDTEQDGERKPDAEKKQDGEKAGRGGKSQPEEKSIPIEISHERKGIVLEEDFMKFCVSIGTGSIYLTGFHGNSEDGEPDRKDYFLERIDEKEMMLLEFDLKVPDDLFGMRGCVDEYGNWHLLLAEKIDGKMTYGKAEIWVIDRQGQKLQTIDCTEMMQTKPVIPFWMAVDENGDYFFANNGTLLWVDGEGHVKKWFETDYLSGLGIGKSGTVYGVFEKADGEVYLGALDPEVGVVEKLTSFSEELLSSFEVLQPGVNTELLLANKGNGVWKYDGEQLEFTCSVNEIVGNGQDIAGMGFPGDGRVCVMSYQQGKYRIDYEPVEE